MITIKATCPQCGEVSLTGDDIELRACPRGVLSFYAFPCPTCREHIRKAAQSNVVSLLASIGVPVLRWDVPVEV